MGHALAVRLVERVGDLDRVLQHLLQRQQAFRKPLRQCFAFQALHDEEVGAVLLADVEERADVRMVEAGDGTSFALESFAQLGPVGQMIRQDLDGHGAVEAGVACAIDFAHPSRAQRRENLVRPEFCSSR